MKFWCLQISKKPTKFLTVFSRNFIAIGQKSVKKGSLFGDLKTPKFHSEINWPLFGCFLWCEHINSNLECYLTKGLVRQTCSSKSSKLYHWRGGPQWTRSPSSRYVCRMVEYRVSHGKMYFFQNPARVLFTHRYTW